MEFILTSSKVDNRLVRYQGVIQDIFNPEYYTAGIFLNHTNETNNSDRFILGKYKEHLHGPQVDEDRELGSVVTMERLKLSTRIILLQFLVVIVIVLHEGLWRY